MGTWDAPILPSAPTGFSYSGFVDSGLDTLGISAGFSSSSGDLGVGGFRSWGVGSGLSSSYAETRDSQIGAAIIADVVLDTR